ncbi:hypothetical protein RRG08_055234 [Elysia crispata]|uniref:Secreted protein n=1 Tax=Elysia crispata TaxID=231223 RepID=A0AAE0XUG1_9GAST|nr:hypothetical protein RRG08_055234 [Elysia crispata]
MMLGMFIFLCPLFHLIGRGRGCAFTILTPIPVLASKQTAATTTKYYDSYRGMEVFKTSLIACLAFMFITSLTRTSAHGLAENWRAPAAGGGAQDVTVPDRTRRQAHYYVGHLHWNTYRNRNRNRNRNRDRQRQGWSRYQTNSNTGPVRDA